MAFSGSNLHNITGGYKTKLQCNFCIVTQALNQARRSPIDNGKNLTSKCL